MMPAKDAAFDSEYTALMQELGESALGQAMPGGLPSVPKNEIPPWRLPENWQNQPFVGKFFSPSKICSGFGIEADAITGGGGGGGGYRGPPGGGAGGGGGGYQQQGGYQGGAGGGQQNPGYGYGGGGAQQGYQGGAAGGGGGGGYGAPGAGQVQGGAPDAYAK